MVDLPSPAGQGFAKAECIVPGCGGRGEHGRFGLCRLCWSAVPGARKIGLARRWADWRIAQQPRRLADFETARAVAAAAAGKRLTKAG